MSIKTLYTLFLICGLLLGGFAAPATAADQSAVEAPQVEVGEPGTVFRYEQAFGETGVPYPADGDHIYNPDGVGLDGAGNLWVVEGAGARVMKYTTDGAFLMSIGTAGVNYLADESHFVSPREVTVDSAGNIWVADMDSQRVVKLDSDGNYLTQLGVTWEGGEDNAHFNGPAGVAFDSAGKIYVSDYYNHRIQIFESNGFYSQTLGVTGIAGDDNAHFRNPYHIFIDDGDNLFVVDEYNHRVQIFDGEHNYVATLGVSGEEGSDNDHFSYPRGVSVDAGYIYVSEGNHRVQIFDRVTRAYHATLGTGGGSGDYQFDWPTDVSVDASGYIYVADVLNQRVQKFDSSLTLVHTFGVTDVPYLTDGYHYNQPFGVAVDSDGDLAIVEDWGRGQRLVVLDSGGVLKFTIGEPGRAGGDNEHFNDPKKVDFDAAGNLYVADCGNHRVQIFDSTGTWIARIGTGWGIGDYEFKCPTGVAVGSNGYVYVSDSDNHRIQIYDSQNMYQYVDTLGVTGVPGSDNEHFKWPQDVEVDGSGDIYVAEWANQRVQVFDSSLAWKMTLGVTGECGNDFNHFCEPYGVAVDAAGNIYVAEKFNYRVQVFDASGAYLTTIGGAWGDSTGNFRNLHSVDVDSAGDVYIADTFNHRVQKFAPGVPGWEQLNINGFGSNASTGVSALEVFSGQLYAGVSNWETGGRVWRTPDGVTWEPASEIGFGGDTTNPAITDLIEFKGQLYAGTGWSGAPGQVWRTADGVTWEAVTTSGFGDGGNTSVDAFGIFNGVLYAGTGNPNGAQIWRSSDGVAWFQVAPDGVVAPGASAVSGFAAFNGGLVAALEGGETAQVWHSPDGSAWTPVVTDGFGDENNISTGGFAEFGGYLYLGSGNDGINYELSVAQLWRSADGVTWELAKGEGFGDPNNQKVDSLFVFEGQLYASLLNRVTGMQLWRTDGVSEWKQVNLGLDGFGDSNNYSSLWSNATAVFECRLTFGTWNDANGGEIWSMLRDKALCVDKSGPDSAYYSQAVTYQMAVTYSSLDGSHAQNVSVHDDYFGGAPYVSGDDGDGYLDTDETWIFEVSGVIGAPGEMEQDPLVNTATVTAQDIDGAAVTQGVDSHTTDILMQVYLTILRSP